MRMTKLLSWNIIIIVSMSTAFSGRSFLLLLLPVLAFYAGTKVQKRLFSVYADDISSELPVVVSTEQAASSGQAASQAPAPERAELVMKALAQAYPDRIGPAEYRDGDWALPLGGQWFYYAGGRLLPEALKDRAAEYSGLPFYNYAAELPPWNPPDPEYSLRMREMTERRRSGSNSQQTVKRSQFFHEALWRISNRDESWERVKQIRFLGHSVMVHYAILKELSLVEERILKEARTNTLVQQWINSLNSIDCWSWRNIADSGSRSFHSYGVAIDILPKSTGGLATYWLWTAQNNIDWWAVPYSRRYHPPEEVIRAFESYGFVWGGKWMVYDTMHFEYRPEIFILSNIPLIDLRTELP